MNVVVTVLITVLLFSLVIIVHEIGHLVAAKLSKVKVNEFSMGFGPVIFTFGKGETKYKLRAIPLGGFVSMEGEIDGSDDDRAFMKKPIWRRFTVLIAGAFMNVVLGFVIFMIVVSMQSTIYTNVVSKFAEKAVTNGANGLKIGDKITNVNGLKVYTTDDIFFGLYRTSDQKADFVVNRDGKKIKLDNVPLILTELDGRKIGVRDFGVYAKNKNVFSVIGEAYNSCYSIVQQVRVSLFDLVTGRESVKSVSGIVGIGSVVGNAVEQGLTVNIAAAVKNVLFLAALITINIGIFNLLPIPGLDGGRILFLIIEGIRRKPIKPEHENYINFAGLALMVLLMIFATFNDITKLITG